MKIYPLHHGVTFYPSVSSFFFLCGSFEKAKGVDELAALSHKTAACTCDIISYVPTINTIITGALSLLFVCTLLHRELHNTSQYIT